MERHVTGARTLSSGVLGAAGPCAGSAVARRSSGRARARSMGRRLRVSAAA